ALFAACLLLNLPAALAQTTDVDEIHVMPRVDSEKSDQPTEDQLTAGEAAVGQPGAGQPAVGQPNSDGDSVRTHAPMITKKVDLVLVPVTVTDPMNRLVTGLDKENFAVYEGKEQQDVRHFSSEDAPISLGVIFDMSGSMSSKIERAREAVTEFFKTANPQDEFFMI